MQKLNNNELMNIYGGGKIITYFNTVYNNIRFFILYNGFKFGIFHF